MAQRNVLKRTTPRSKRRLGRGQSSGAGKTSGRGTKGQNARAGRKKRPEIRDFIKKLPKRRGFGKNRARGTVGSRVLPVTVSLEKINAVIVKGDIVTPAFLIEKGVVSLRGGKVPAVKILAAETCAAAVSVSGCMVSRGARVAIEKAGGTVA